MNNIYICCERMINYCSPADKRLNRFVSASAFCRELCHSCLCLMWANKSKSERWKNAFNKLVNAQNALRVKE